jgi:hypothetical protein
MRTLGEEFGGGGVEGRLSSAASGRTGMVWIFEGSIGSAIATVVNPTVFRMRQANRWCGRWLDIGHI